MHKGSEKISNKIGIRSRLLTWNINNLTADKHQHGDVQMSSEVIGKLSRGDYMSRFARVDDLNY